MTRVNVTTREGEQVVIDAEDGVSVMEAMRDGGIDEVLALCGGCVSCATCQVYVEPSFFTQLPEMSEDESDLLDGSGIRQATSRLACQIVLDAALDGISVTVAPAD